MSRLIEPLDPMRLIGWVSGASLSSELPIRDRDPDPGLLGPDSVTWRLHNEQWLIAAGARSFLLQAAHPVVAQGALDHSRFAEDPFGRVFSTIQAIAVLLFGTTREANEMARRINRLHHTVRGTLSATAGRYPAGSAYSAMDPSGLLWVHVAFVDSILTAYQTFVGPLGDEEREQYWAESCRYARHLGLTDAELPPTYAAMRAYLRAAIASGEIAVGQGARTIAQTILHPPLPWARRPLWAGVRLITLGQLPPAIREQYAVAWTWRHEAGFRALAGTMRLLRRTFPRFFGRSVLAGYAMRRVRGELLAEKTQPVRMAEQSAPSR